MFSQLTKKSSNQIGEKQSVKSSSFGEGKFEVSVLLCPILCLNKGLKVLSHEFSSHQKNENIKLHSKFAIKLLEEKNY